MAESRRRLAPTPMSLSPTPPDRLVPSFQFVTADTPRDAAATSIPQHASSSRSNAARPVYDELEGLTKAWEGRVVFSDEPIPIEVSTPAKKVASGSHTSPISITSSSPDTTPRRTNTNLSRPRARIRYSTPEAGTAYTPPPPPLPILPNPDATDDKPLHPFFQRDFKRSQSVPSPSQPKVRRPRLVAHYSSTSASASNTQETASQASTDSWRVSRYEEIELVSHTFEDNWTREDEDEVFEREFGINQEDTGKVRRHEDRLDKLAAMLEDLTIPAGPIPGSGSVSTRKPLTTPPILPTRPSPIITIKPNVSVPTSESIKPINSSKPTPLAKSPGQYFHYRNLPNPPRLVYTKDPDETNDLLSCLSGNVLAFDMEWPITGTKIAQGSKRVGMKFDPVTNKWTYSQPPVALLQFADDKLVILVHVWDMKQLPEKVIEILANREIYKIGVAIRGDGQKLYRDYPTSFADGINSLVDLSTLARRVDPIRTGPGNTIISMANLVKGFLGVHLDKEEGVRKGNWVGDLDQTQRDYAANDVVVSMELYHLYHTIARQNNKSLDLDSVAFDLTLNPSNPSAPARSPVTDTMSAISTAPAASAVPDPAIPLRSGSKGPTPSEYRALSAYKAGETIVSIAASGGVRTSTVESYIARALAILPPDVISLEQKKSFLAGIPETSGSRKFAAVHLKRLRREISEEVSSSEGEEERRGEGAA